LIAAVIVACSREANAENPCPDPGCHITSPSTLTTERGSVLTLPPGYFLDEPTWLRRDVELKGAQDQVTRLRAENESFRKDAAKFSWAPIVGIVASFAGSALIYSLVK
jgi:hypothetical protein